MKRSAALLALVCTSFLVLGPEAGVAWGPSVGEALAQGGVARPTAAEAPARGPRLRLQPLESRACKPQAPLAVVFDVAPLAGNEGLLRVEVEVQPVIDLADAAWALELPPGLSAMGPSSGAVDPRAGVATRRTLLLEWVGPAGPVPSGLGELALTVRGTLHGGAGAAVLTRRSAVQLSAGDAGVRALRPSTEAGTGARRRVAVLPVRHRSGR